MGTETASVTKLAWDIMFNARRLKRFRFRYIAECQKVLKKSGLTYKVSAAGCQNLNGGPLNTWKLIRLCACPSASVGLHTISVISQSLIL